MLLKNLHEARLENFRFNESIKSKHSIFYFSELEEKFAVLKEEYDKIMEERRIAREEKEARELELQHMMKVSLYLDLLLKKCKIFCVIIIGCFNKKNI